MAYYYVTLARQRSGVLLHESIIEVLDSDDWPSAMLVIVDENGILANTAAWDRRWHWIRFGTNRPLVLDSLVTFHEYAHAIFDLITGEPFFPHAYGDSAPVAKQLATATYEGYADYLACSLKDYPKVLEGNSGVRHLDRPVDFNPGQRRNVYPDSLSLSTGLWQLRV